MKVPLSEGAVTVNVTLSEGIKLSGTIGLQEGDRMSIALTRLNPDPSESIL